MTYRQLRARYPGTCTVCTVAIPAGSPAWWDVDTRTLRCETCGDDPVREKAAARLVLIAVDGLDDPAVTEPAELLARVVAQDVTEDEDGHPEIRQGVAQVIQDETGTSSGSELPVPAGDKVVTDSGSWPVPSSSS